MSEPDSLHVAAQRLAQVSGLSWGEVQPFYRALQEDGGRHNSPWLPKSVGRHVWAAHPHFIARLMFAIAGGQGVERSHDSVEMARALTPGGRRKHLDEEDAAGVLAPLEREFFISLTDLKRASALSSVEFRPDVGQVIVTTKAKPQIIFARAKVLRDGEADAAKPFRGFRTRTVIDGLVFRYLAETVNWRLEDAAPFRPAKIGETD